MSTVTFATPLLALLALAAAVLSVLAAGWLWRRRLAATEAWAAQGLWRRLLPGLSRRRLTASVVLLGLAVGLAVTALARPRWGTSEQTVERQGVDVVLVVDTSLSMGAEDVSPSRLTVAASLVRRLVGRLPGHRLALVGAEGDGTVLAPLTTDVAVIDLLLDGLAPGALPTPGTELGDALARAGELFPDSKGTHRAVILVSDGEDHGGGLVEAAGKLAAAGASLYTVGVGTPQGATVPVPGLPGAVKRHPDGSVVISRLDEELLDRAARASGGLYLRATGAGTDLSPLVEAIGDIPTYALESSAVDSRAERFQWPLAAAVLLLALHLAVPPFGRRRADRPPLVSRRPRRQMAEATLCLFLLPGWADVAGWLDLHPPAWVERVLWNSGDRTDEGLAELEEGDTLAAVEELERAHRIAPDDPRVAYNAGTGRLLAGRGDAAPLLQATASATPPGLAPDAWYNLGNAYLDADRPGRAIGAYEEALRRRPDFADAKFNLEVALARAAEDRLRFGPPEESPEGSQGGEQEESDRSDEDGRRPPEEEQDDEDSPKTDPAGDRPEDEASDDRDGGRRPQPLLPDFEEQDDMTAEQAAALLQAVENLERRERRARAAEAAARSERAEKDW